MQGKIKNINKKHTRKALTEPQWKNCRVTAAAFQGTVVFPVSEVLLTCQLCLCVRPGDSVCPVLLMVIFIPVPFPHHFWTDVICSREHRLLLFSLPLLFLSSYHSLSFLCFSISLPPPVFKSERVTEWERNRINTREDVLIRHKWHRAPTTNSCMDNDKIFLYFCLSFRIAFVRW